MPDHERNPLVVAFPADRPTVGHQGAGDVAVMEGLVMKSGFGPQVAPLIAAGLLALARRGG